MTVNRSLLVKAIDELGGLDHINSCDQQESYERAKAMLHEQGINDCILGTANTKLFPIAEDGKLVWAVRVEHIIGGEGHSHNE